MPSRAGTSFLQYPFKNLGFMRLPEPLFAGIYQNILTMFIFMHVHNLDISFKVLLLFHCLEYIINLLFCHQFFSLFTLQNF